MLHHLIPELVEAVRAEFQNRSNGHCLRIDNLPPETASQLCRELRRIPAIEFESYVLSSAAGSTDELRPDQAIELRNRKESSLCLIVPGGMGHVTASSLGNSFASLDLGRFLQMTAERLEHAFPDDVQVLLRRVRAQLKGRASVSLEDLIEFYLKAKENPEPFSIGRELWRVGLIPDPNTVLYNGFSGTESVSMPSPVQPGLRAQQPKDWPRQVFLTALSTRLAGYLSERVLHQTAAWQESIAHDPSWADLVFNLWPFPDQEVSELQAIEVEPFLNADGRVEPYCKLKQPLVRPTFAVFVYQPERPLKLVV